MKEDFKVKDHSVSGEEFTLKYDEKYHMYFTIPKPEISKLPSYYESEDYISHTDGKRSLFEIAYQTIKGITLSRKQKLLKMFNPDQGSVLDIGAGTGDFLEFLSKRKWNVKGVEPNDKAKKLAQHKGLDIYNTIDEVGGELYDVITMWHVLEHVYDLQEQIAWLKKQLAKNGTIFIAVPNFESFDASYYKSYWAAFDVPRHLYHFSETSIKRLFAEQDLQLVKTLPMKFDSYYVSLLSEKYKSGKMNFFTAFVTGFKSNRKAKRSGGYSSHIYVLKHA
ncbi:class I SAM-dependent methyltransferase [Dokdonia sp. Asnod1-B02]|uniref:class I SAM-dependent methyltransferase n=1 Tax=Dokdonia sp. Asnod1-B02 TaxID=3160573 RepID=UPI00386D8D9D